MLSGITVQATARSQQLDIRIILSESYQDNTVNGLMGNINGDPNDDLTTPSGDIIPPDSSEKDIFEQFGQKCKGIYFFIKHSKLYMNPFV